MPVTTEENVKGKGKGKGKGANQTPASGTTAPLPTSEGKAKDPAKDKELSELAKAQNAAKEAKAKEIAETREKLKALQDKLKAEKDEQKAIDDAVKALKDAEKNKGKAEREAKEKAIKEADEAVAAAQKDLEATEEWSFLVAAKEARTALGSLPKVRKAKEGGGGGGSKKAKNGLTPNMIKLLKVMADGVSRGSAELAELSGIAKGKPFPEMYDMGLINISVPNEGERGRRFTILQAGLDALEKAEAEPETPAAETPAE